ncbi:hypothetical protein RHMOL_Rhmol05G0035700 [Rhododendron molle]|uniref:Uncharacterized protein n=1 Tax=Rhododendron molle TaxID=49168 RepID=A0ACC0NK03_RHOML|nr:hypothetical protein RHMOL_Rhmol05G0035700 [Rhododendron molle]
MTVGSGNGGCFWALAVVAWRWMGGAGWGRHGGRGLFAGGDVCRFCRRFLAGWGSKGSWIWRSLAVQVLESLVVDGGCVGWRHHGVSDGGDWGTWWFLGQQQGGGSDGSATRGQRCNGARWQQCNGGNEGGFSGSSSHVMAAWWRYFSDDNGSTGMGGASCTKIVRKNSK